jgi:hypothetical protein
LELELSYPVVEAEGLSGARHLIARFDWGQSLNTPITKRQQPINRNGHIK